MEYCKEMRILICKNCCFYDDQSSDSWKIKTTEDSGELQCPKCDETEFVRLVINIQDIKK